MLSKRDPLYRRTLRQVKIKEWKKIYHANNTDQKKARVAKSVLHKVDFRANITRNKEGHLIMTNDKIILKCLCIYSRALKYEGKTAIIDKFTTDFHPLSQ